MTLSILSVRTVYVVVIKCDVIDDDGGDDVISDEFGVMVSDGE